MLCVGGACARVDLPPAPEPTIPEMRHCPRSEHDNLPHVDALTMPQQSAQALIALRNSRSSRQQAMSAPKAHRSLPVSENKISTHEMEMKNEQGSLLFWM
jgi:hypothetical protein